MQLIITGRDGLTQSYSDVELAEGDVVVDTQLSGSGGIEQVESGSMSLAVYNEFQGARTLDEYFNTIDSDFEYLQARITDAGGSVTGSIYEGDIQYDEVSRRFTFDFLADAEAVLRDRLRKVALRDVVTDASQAVEQVIFTAGAPVTENLTPLYPGTLRHVEGSAGVRDPQEDSGLTESFAGWQSVGAIMAWLPSDLLTQVIDSQSNLDVDPEATSAHDTDPVVGEIPGIPAQNAKYKRQPVDTKGSPRIWQVDDWEGPIGESQPRKDITGVPDWTGEELLDYYLQRTGRRVIAEYDGTSLTRINIYFADDTPELTASDSIDTAVPATGIEPGADREQDFYTAETKRPRLPDLAVQIGQLAEESITASDPGHTGLLDVRQQGVHADGNRDSTGWYTPYNWIRDSSIDALDELTVDTYRITYRDRDDRALDGYDYWSAWVQPPYAKYASERWSAGRETKIVEGPESTINLPVELPQLLFPMKHVRGDTRGQANRAQRNHVFDPLKDPYFRPGSKGAATLDFLFPEQYETADSHQYKIRNTDGEPDANELYNGTDGIGITTPWLVQYQYGYPIVPYESDAVYETVVAEGSRVERAFNQPASLLWTDLREPGEQRYQLAGDGNKNNQLTYIAKAYRDRELIETDTSITDPVFPVDRDLLNDASSLLGIDGLSKPPVQSPTQDEVQQRGYGGLYNASWAWHTWALHKASTLERLQVTVEVDTAELDYQVGDSNKALSWRGYTWLVAEEERRVDRTVSTLVLERYVTRSRELYSSERQATVGAPRDVTSQITATHLLRKDDQAKGDQQGSTIRGGQEKSFRLVQWAPPRWEDQLAIMYYEVQALDTSNWQQVWQRRAVTTGTAIYLSWSPAELTFVDSPIRVRAVGWPTRETLQVKELDATAPYDPAEPASTRTIEVATPVVSDWIYSTEQDVSLQRPEL